MTFSSLDFVLFFCVVYGLYLALQWTTPVQNILLLGTSYFFYGYWDIRFLGLLAFTTAADFYFGLKIENESTPGRRKAFLVGSVVLNLAVLGFFKYFDFFTVSAMDLLKQMGLEVNLAVLNILLPVGISFYTFQSMSYTIDVYRRELKAEPNFVNFALFVSFFPQLVAGPIERAGTLLSQIKSPRRITVDQLNAGLSLLLWGVFQKVVVADNIGRLVAEPVFSNTHDFAGMDAAVGLIGFAVQIYSDFAGYSNIARGLAKWMGFDLMINFRNPYFAENPRDFWSRWHISLSTWLRDYLYIPLGGNRRGPWRTMRNLALTMALGGLWHGARATFLVWGLFHGLLLAAHRWGTGTSLARVFRFQILNRVLMLIFVLIGWAFFRCATVSQALAMLRSILDWSRPWNPDFLHALVFFSLPLIIMETIQFKKNDLLILSKAPSWLKIACYGFFLTWIFIFANRTTMEFIYFQF